MESEQFNKSSEIEPTAPVIEPGYTFASVTDKISAIVLTQRTPRFWYVGFGLSFILVLVLLFGTAYLLTMGVGVWGINIPVGWGFAIVNFVWWIGIGHAGTLISAILLLLRQKWRQSINRFAEAMTLFAVACAGMFPLLHLGRPWYAYLLMAGLATPLVVSVHTVVSFDFAVGLVPGWHSTIFPPYFVAGAIYSGFAMVLTLAIPLRKLYGLEDFITLRHLKNMGEVMLATGLIVAYGYIMETFSAWYSGNIYEQYMMWNRMFGPYWFMYWALILFNILVPQALWFGTVRTNPVALFIIAICVNVGMWLERYVIVVVSLSRDFLPSSWGMYSATVWDYAIFVGSIGLFVCLLFLFIRVLPMISIFEMRELVHDTEESR